MVFLSRKSPKKRLLGWAFGNPIGKLFLSFGSGVNILAATQTT
jgi:hypothetical protein